MNMVQSPPDDSEIHQTIVDIKMRQVEYVIWHTSHSSVAFFLTMIFVFTLEVTNLKAPLIYFIHLIAYISASYALFHQITMHKQTYMDDKAIIELHSKLYQPYS